MIIYQNAISNQIYFRMNFENLIFEMTFEADAFTTEPLELCVRHNTFHVVFSAQSVTVRWSLDTDSEINKVPNTLYIS